MLSQTSPGHALHLHFPQSLCFSFNYDYFFNYPSPFFLSSSSFCLGSKVTFSWHRNATSIQCWWLMQALARQCFWRQGEHSANCSPSLLWRSAGVFSPLWIRTLLFFPQQQQPEYSVPTLQQFVRAFLLIGESLGLVCCNAACYTARHFKGEK